MVANRVSHAKGLSEAFPNRLGCLFGLDDHNRNPNGLPFALDNGKFSVWAKGVDWQEKTYWRLIESVANKGLTPLWIVVPDVVTKPKETAEQYIKWAPLLRPFGWPLALAVQDGMSVEDATALGPDVIFIGGTKRWKWRTLDTWCRNFSRVHVGRVNVWKELWTADRAGAESSDGTGWFYKDQAKQLSEYLKRSHSGQTEYGREKGLIY